MRPMIVRDRKISSATLVRIVQDLRTDAEPFTCAELAVRYGPDARYVDEAEVVAQRLIDRLKRAGAITKCNGTWRFANSLDVGPGTLRAYQVLEDDERTGGIVFAADMVQAKALGARQHHHGETDGLIVERVKWADRYSPGPVPFRVKFRHGWHQDCMHCGQEISDSAEYENGRPIRFDIVERPNGQVFCRTSCALGFDAEVRRAARGKAAGIKLGETLVRRRLGAAQFIPEQGYVEFDKCGRHTLFKRISVSFTIPGHDFGMLHMTMRRDDDTIGPVQPRFFAAPEYAGAFSAYAKQVKSKAAA